MNARPDETAGKTPDPPPAGEPATVDAPTVDAPTGEPATVQEAVFRWHGLLQLRRHRGDRAALRRADGPDDAYVVEMFHTLYGLLRQVRPDFDHAVAAPMALAVAAIDTDTAPWTERRPPVGQTLGRAFAAAKGDGRVLSEDRLRLLTSAEEPEQFLRLLRSALQQLNRKAPVIDTALVIRDWQGPDSRTAARRQLFLGYFQSATPADQEPETTDA